MGTWELQFLTAVFLLLVLAASLGKVDSWLAWTSTVSRIFPSNVAVQRFVRLGVPLTEAILVLLIIVRPVLGLAGAGLLLLLFATGVALLSLRQQGEPCRCFGALMPTRITPALAARNLVLGLLALGAAYASADNGLRPFRALELLGLGVSGMIVLLTFEFRRFHRESIPSSAFSPTRSEE